jgi:hypothetical protein
MIQLFTFCVVKGRFASLPGLRDLLLFAHLLSENEALEVKL